MGVLQLQVRMAFTVIIFASMYGLLASGIATVTGIPFLLVFFGVTVLLVVGYTTARKLILEQANARKVPEEEAPNLFRLVEKTSNELGVDKPQIMVGDFGGPNCFAVGRTSDGTVIVSEQLVESLDADELAAVLTHEISHIRNRDVILMVLAQTPAILFGHFIGKLREHHIGLTHFKRIDKMTEILVLLSAYIFVFPITRYRDSLADSITSEQVGGDALASALQKIADQYGYNTPSSNPALRGLFFYNTPQNGVAGVFSTHLSVQSRIDELSDGFDY